MLNKEQKAHLLKKAKSGHYYLYLQPYNSSRDQYIIMFPTNKGLTEGVPLRRNKIKVRNAKMTGNFDKSKGAAYKAGRFFTINNSLAKVLNYNLKK